MVIANVFCRRIFYCPTKVGLGVGWGGGINVHVHVHTSPTLASHLIILDDMSGVRWGRVGWGGVLNVHVHVHTSSTLTSYLVILDDTSGVRYLSFVTADELRRGEQKLPFADRCIWKTETL